MNGCQSKILKLLSSFIVCLLPLSACSDDSSEGSAGGSADSVSTEVRRQSDPMAELTADIAVTTLSSEASSLEAASNEVQTKHGSQIEQFKESLCKTLQDAPSKDADDLRATAEEAVRDSFVFKFIQRAAREPQERQVAIVQTMGIKSSGADGSPQEGAAALKDASLLKSDGSLQLPDRGTTEYTKYTDWLMKNDSLLGFTDTVTKDYTEAIRGCSLD